MHQKRLFKLIVLQLVDPLLGNDCKQTSSHGNESTCNNRGTVGSGVFCGLHCGCATQLHSKHASAATNPDATTEELFEVVFSVQLMPRGYQSDKFRS
jgi:hypothetical protein